MSGRLLSKAMLCPSGDQSGSSESLCPGVDVSFWMALRLGLAVKISLQQGPGTTPLNAIRPFLPPTVAGAWVGKRAAAKTRATTSETTVAGAARRRSLAGIRYSYQLHA